MVPNSDLDPELSVVNTRQTSKTYKITDNKIQGTVDKLSALEQAIYKILNTEKYEFPIYSFQYGIELESLIGKDPIYVKAELKRRIQECLLEDERIQSVENFIYSISGDEIICTFDVSSIYGELAISKEVNF